MRCTCQRHSPRPEVKGCVQGGDDEVGVVSAELAGERHARVALDLRLIFRHTAPDTSVS
jgi:hypothetical protein